MEVISAPDAPLNGLLRLRVIVVTTMMVVVALAAGDIFGRTNVWLLIAPAAVGATALIDRRWPTRFVICTAVAIAAIVTIVVGTRGTSADISTAVTSGPQRLLTSDWPSPELPDLFGTVGAALCVATAMAAFAARRATMHLTPLLPIVVAYVAVIALSAPLGVRPQWILPLGVLALVLAALRPDRGVELPERLALLRGERRLLGASAVAIGTAALIAVPLVLTDRSDPRRNEPADRSAALLDPIEATLALQAIDPPIDLHAVTITGDAAPTKWRTASLVAYDGERWESDATLRPIGRRLGDTSGEWIDASVRFIDGDQRLVPLPGRPVMVDALIETDAERNVVRLVERPVEGESVTITADLGPDRASLAAGRIGTRELDENASSLTDLAQGLAEAGGADPSASLLERLDAIEATMRNDFALRPDASGAGLQRTLIDRFLRDTQQGNAEQFSTAFVLLARSLGVDARIATGFDVDPVRIRTDDGTTTMVMTSSDAAIWPEIRVDEEWVAFDPVPAEVASDATPPEPESQTQTPAAAQPPIPPPPESSDEPVVTEEAEPTETQWGLPIVVTWFLRSVTAAALFLIPVVLGTLFVLGAKWRRRRRLLSGTPVERIRGAWALATNRLVDAGMSIALADTNNEIAELGEDHVPAARRELRRLASLASATTFGAPARPDLLAQDAVFCLGSVERALAESRTRWQRVRWQLSLRSLRTSTASPV